MSESMMMCESCGSPAIVRVTDEDAGEAVLHHLCHRCAEAAGPKAGLRGPNLAALLVCVGAFVLLISVLADVLAFGSTLGFGFQQLGAVLVAGVLVVLGAVLRISTISVIGIATGLIAVLADWLAFGSSPGFGAQQISGSFIGAMLICVGLVLARTIREDNP